MVQIVNGYACHNSADVALARRGVAPAAAPRAVAGGDALPNTPSGATDGGPGVASSVAPPRAGRGSLVDLIA